MRFPFSSSIQHSAFRLQHFFLMRFLHHRFLRLAMGVVARPKLTLVLAGLTLVGSIILAKARLGVASDQNSLFSHKVGFFRDWLEFDRQFPENDALYVVIQPKDPAKPPATPRWTAASDDVAWRIRRLPAKVVVSVDNRVPLTQLGAQGLLFKDAAGVRESLNDFKQFVPLVKQVGEAPGTFGAAFMGRTPTSRLISTMGLRPPDAESAKFISELADSWNYSLQHPGEPLKPGQGLPDFVALAASDPSDMGYYYQPDQTNPSRSLLLVNVYPADDPTSLTAGTEAVEAIRAAVDESAKSFPEFTFGTTGRPALDADESKTTDHDSMLSEIVALSAVFIGLVWALRSIWLALAAEICLAVGIGWTFGWATVSVGKLNLLSTVFLIALIGIGMDYLVQVLMRYRQESARRSSPRRIWLAVFKHVSAPINTACLGAAGAFLVSNLTQFRGAAELGIIAGGGLLLCLLSGYTVLPALLVLFPARPWKVQNGKGSLRGGMPRGNAMTFPSSSTPGEDRDGVVAGISFGRTPSPTLPQSAGGGKNGHPQEWVLDYASAPTGLRPERGGTPRLSSKSRRLLLPVIWAVALIPAAFFALRTEFDPGLLDLQAPNLESVKLIRKLQTWSAVVMSKDLAQLRQAREQLKGLPTVADTDSLLGAYDNADWLRQHSGELPGIRWGDPKAVTDKDMGTIAEQARKLADRYDSAAETQPAGAEAPATGAAKALREFADQLTAPNPAAQAASLSAWQISFLQELKGMIAQFQPKPVDLAALPNELRRHYLSDEGIYAMYIDPKEDLWDRQNLERFVLDVEGRIPATSDGPVVTGIASNIYHSTRAIESSFYRATAYALGLILLLVLIDLRKVSQTLLAVSVLALGLPMLVGLMGLLHAKWNFANFFALPILIGAGHEYGVFMVHRYREARHDPRRAWRGWDISDRALLLCAFVTSTSFGFFWLFAHHQGLRSLGLVMALGTACIYLATLCVLRPLLLWRLEKDTARNLRKTSPHLAGVMRAVR
jgi:predicted RND superfamily exporter protein